MSQLQIYNMALSHIGARNSVSDVSENSVEARTCTLWYEDTRKTILETQDWSFARKQASLVENSSPDPLVEWGYRFNYPNDALAIRYLTFPGIGNSFLGRNSDLYSMSNLNSIPYEIRLSPSGTGRVILCNLSEADAVYTTDVTDTDLYPRHFTLAFSYLLAHHISFKLTGKTQIADRMYQLFIHTRTNAAADDGNEEIGRAIRDSEIILGRM